MNTFSLLLLSSLFATGSAFAPLLPSTASSTITRLAASTDEVVTAAATNGVTATAADTRTGQELSALTASVTTVFTTEEIDKILPHRYPFALVDKVVVYEPGKRAVGIKSVTKVRRRILLWYYSRGWIVARTPYWQYLGGHLCPCQQPIPQGVI
jgi:hypothetical protein